MSGFDTGLGVVLMRTSGLISIYIVIINRNQMSATEFSDFVFVCRVSPHERLTQTAAEAFADAANFASDSPRACILSGASAECLSPLAFGGCC